ncbi:hypothetical protein H4R33_006502 [Dimargaris cristalligena]|nr:hypothetical protein H4R33_006502 [Dimargaris cristalligena]
MSFMSRIPDFMPNVLHYGRTYPVPLRPALFPRPHPIAPNPGPSSFNSTDPTVTSALLDLTNSTTALSPGSESTIIVFPSTPHSHNTQLFPPGHLSPTTVKPRLSHRPKSHGSFRYYSEMDHIPPDPEEEQRKRERRREQNKNASKQFRERKKSEKQRQLKEHQDLEAKVDFFTQQVEQLQILADAPELTDMAVSELPRADELLRNRSLLDSLQCPNPPDVVYRDPGTMTMEEIRQEIDQLHINNHELRVLNSKVDSDVST